VVESDPEVRVSHAGGFTHLLEVFGKGMLAMRDHGDLRADADPLNPCVLAGAVQGGLLLAQILRHL
jgi:hypothetical protein